MKVIKEKSDKEPTAITFRLPKDLIDKVTKVAKDNDVSRQKLVTAILQQALSDRSFKVVINE